MLSQVRALTYLTHPTEDPTLNDDRLAHVTEGMLRAAIYEAMEAEFEDDEFIGRVMAGSGEVASRVLALLTVACPPSRE